MDWDRFQDKVRSFLTEHEDNLAIQRLRRNRQLTEDDLEELGRILEASGGPGRIDIARVREKAGSLGLFMRSLVGLDRAAAVEAYGDYLDDSRFSVEQIRFVTMIVDELFPRDYSEIMSILRTVKERAEPAEVA